MDGSEWSFDNLNSICWAIGSISGCLPEQDEKQFLIHTIKNLLSLCEVKKGKENKAVVAANIMYVVGQYPKFLRTNWNFLKTVIKKLFEFMKESFPGVQEMACNTFLTISQKCGKEFVIRQQIQSDQLEREPYICELIRNIRDQVAILQDQYKLVYYESLSHMIKFEEDLNIRIQLVNSLVKHLNDQLIQYTSSNNYIDLFKDEKIQQFFIQYFRILQQIVQPTGYAFTQSLIQLLPTYNQIYLFYSQSIQQQVIGQGIVVMGWYTVKKQRAVKKEILKLYATYFQHNDQELLNKNYQLKNSLVIPICNLLEEYSQSINEQKEPELLLTFKYMLEKFLTPIEDLVPLILKGLFDATIRLISQDFNSYPDHRINFFEFLRSCVQYHLVALFNMPQDQFKLMIDCIVWAFKHQVPNLQELGLDVLYYILQQVNSDAVVANQFYSLYHLRLLKDILEILTDNLHASGFKHQSQILMILFQVASNQQITTKLSNEQVGSNLEFISQYLVTSLYNAFPNVSKQQTELHIARMFQNLNNAHNFRQELSDYLINLKQFQESNDHLKQPENKEDLLTPKPQ
ncbi:unnamed protein product [Paramecium pentaurelia]|uniref:Exportin-1 C-terminal domain-containing protein n=1 Tax=Paramecium pentaurelia TaxID=43138 RepID=A0A8S1TKK8_9CILI|nr:unnamed protein product [Paramecium pentaurelia]